jgi:hypothetical protein
MAELAGRNRQGEGRELDPIICAGQSHNFGLLRSLCLEFLVPSWVPRRLNARTKKRRSWRARSIVHPAACTAPLGPPLGAHDGARSHRSSSTTRPKLSAYCQATLRASSAGGSITSRTYQAPTCAWHKNSLAWHTNSFGRGPTTIPTVRAQLSCCAAGPDTTRSPGPWKRTGARWCWLSEQDL